MIFPNSLRTLVRFLAVGAASVLCGDRTADADEPFPPALVQFSPYPHNPVFTAAGPGHWDTKIRERGWILKEGDTWRMWYTGYDGTREGQKKLGLATSCDGLKWTRDPRNPIYQQHWVEDMQVVQHDNRYYMFAEGRDDQAQLLASSDGVQWKRIGTLDVRLKNGKLITPGPYGTPVAFFEKGVWNLFYERRDAGIWLARSTDMKVWTNVQDEPVLSPGPELYDREYVAMNQIVKQGDRYYAYYHGAATPEPQLDQEGKRRPALWSTAIAVSDDLIHWTKYSKNPLFPIAENKSSGILIQLENENRLYTMHDQVNIHIHHKELAR